LISFNALVLNKLMWIQTAPNLKRQHMVASWDAAGVRDRRMSFIAQPEVVLMVGIAILSIVFTELQSLMQGAGAEWMVLAAFFIPLFVAVFLVPPPLETLPAGLLPALRQTKPCAMFAGVLLPLPERPPATPYKIF